ncbi:MAG: hypothetical protein ACPGES_05385 [Coraliomargarita sp.]
MKNPTLCFISMAVLLAVSDASATLATDSPVLQPIHTRFAQTQEHFSVEFSIWSFSDFELEEADEFDGWSTAVEFVWPLPFEKTEDMQLRFILPYYTEGDAVNTDESKVDVGEDIDIDGYGGVYEFMTLQFEHQLYALEADGFNGAYYFGFGKRTEVLDTSTVSEDRFNHSGQVIVAGVKYDRPIWDGRAHWLVNTGVRGYLDTDDLHVDDKVDFLFGDLKTALVFEPLGEHFVPVVELTYLGDFDYNWISLEPEVIIPFNERASAKVGGMFGLTSDGNQAGGQASLVINF